MGSIRQVFGKSSNNDFLSRFLDLHLANTPESAQYSHRFSMRERGSFRQFKLIAVPDRIEIFSCGEFYIRSRHAEAGGVSHA